MDQGLSVWWVCLGAYLFTSWKSTVRQCYQFALAVTTILDVQLTDSFTGTRSITPNLSSLSSPALTDADQWTGTLLGVKIETGLANLSTNRGGESFMRGSACISQQLKALLEYLSKMYFFSLGRFSLVGLHGSCGECPGGSVRAGQLQGLSIGPAIPW